MSGVPITIPSLPAVTPTGVDSVALWDQETGIQGKATLTQLGSVLALLTGATFTGNLACDAVIIANPYDNGAGGGRSVVSANNTNATTPAPGAFVGRRSTGASQSIYSDDTGLIRTINASSVTNALMNSGTVVGTQTSSLDEKDVTGEAAPMDEILAWIGEGAAAVRRFQYKPGMNYDTGQREGDRPYGGEEFSGVIVDYVGRYGTDRDETHPNGKGLNTINAIGDLLMAVNYVAEQLAVALMRIEVLELAREEGG